MKKLVSLLLVLLAASAASAASAADEPQAAPIRLVYAVQGGCPSEAAFVDGVRARTTRFSRGDGAATQTWTVRAVRDAERGVFDGSLEIRDAGGAARERHVEGETCAEVAAAIALIGALAIDADAGRPRSRAAEGARQTSPATAHPTPIEDAPPRTPAAPAEDRREHPLAVGAAGAVHGAVAPKPVAGLAVFAEARASRAGLFSPTVRGAFERSLTTTAVAGGGSARFDLTMGSLEACPSRWRRGPVSLSPCARGEIGSLHGDGREITPSREDNRLWLAVGALARGEIEVAGPVSLEAAVGLRAPLSRTRWIFQPDTTVFRPDAIGFLASAGLSVHFP